MNCIVCRSFAGGLLLALLFGQQGFGTQPAGSASAPFEASNPVAWDTTSERDDEREVYAPLISQLFAPDNDLLDAEGRYITPTRLDQDSDGAADADAVTILDLNQDGELDGRDLDTWCERLQVVHDMPEPVDLDGDGFITEEDLKGTDRVRVLGRDMFAEYDLTLDINGNGEVNRLDFALLTCEIARHCARSGLALRWNGEQVDPNSAPVHFDGVSVVWATPKDVRYLAELSASAPAGPVPASFGEQGFWSDPPITPSTPAYPPGWPPGGCPAITTDTGWPRQGPTPIFTVTWFETFATGCWVWSQNITYNCTATIALSYYNNIDTHLPCGQYEASVTIEKCHTTQSSVSTTAGIAIDSKVNMSVTWGSSTTVTTRETVTRTYGKLGTPSEDCDMIYYMRMKKWTIDITRTPVGTVPWHCWEQNIHSQHEVIYKPSSEGRTVATCWCGCPIEPGD